jgi:hypothetical protein
MMESTRLNWPAPGVRTTVALAIMLLTPGGAVARADTPPPDLLPLEDVSMANSKIREHSLPVSRSW